MRNKLKIQHKYFINIKSNNSIIIVSIVIMCIMLFFMVSCIFFNDTHLSKNLVNNYKKSVQMLITGMSLGVSNYLLQQITRNKLCDSSILGFGNINLIPMSLLCIFTNFSLDPNSNKISIDTYNKIMPFIIISVSIGICLLFMYASKEWFKINLNKILISGIILNFISIAIAFSIIAFANPRAKIEIEHYTIGYISSNINDINFYSCVSISIFALIIILVFSRKINIVILNQEIAKQVGINNISIISLTMICIGLMIGSSYSMSGDFVFVGLIAANITSNFHKKSLANSIIISGIIGAIMVMGTYFIFFNLINVPNYIIAPLIPILISPYFMYSIIKK